MRRQTALQEERDRVDGEVEGRMGRLRGEKPLGSLWLVRFLNKQTEALLHMPPIHPPRAKSHLSVNSAEDQRMERQRDRTGAAAADSSHPSIEPASAMHKTNCWHKVTQRAEQGLVGGQEESIPPSLHLSIDIPGSPSSASGSCNYNQTAASRPPSPDWRLGLSETRRSFGMLCVCVCVCVCVPVRQSSVHLRVHSTLLCLCSMLQHQNWCLSICPLLLSASWCCLYMCVNVCLRVQMTCQACAWGGAWAWRVRNTMYSRISMRSHCV